MPPANQRSVRVTCPKCGHVQTEPRQAYSSLCKRCQAHFRLEEALRPARQPKGPAIAQREVQCFECGALLQAPVAAESTLCKRCGRHVDLADYRITATVSKNFRTHGRLVLEEKGYILNTDSQVGEGVLKGRLIGRIVAVRRLEIHSSASIKGSFQAGCLVVPAGQHFGWAASLQAGEAEIAGELAASSLQASGTVRLKAGARFFGDIAAANLVVEAGAVFVGTARVGAGASS